MIDPDSVIRLSPGVRLHMRDDRNGYVESPGGVRRLEGTGLRLLADEILPRLNGAARSGDIAVALEPALPRDRVFELLEGLRSQGIIECPPREPRPPDGKPAARAVAVHGPDDLTRDLVAVLRRIPRAEVHDLGEPAASGAGPLGGVAAALVVVATTSLFDPRPGAAARHCVGEGVACLSYGLLPGGPAFAGPLWGPGRTAACYECLRTRIFANSVHGRTWRSYTRFLAAAGSRPAARQVPPWTAAKLAGAVGQRVANWLSGPGDDPPEKLLWLADDGEETARHMLPVPTCPVCADRRRGTAGGTADGGGAAVSPAAAVDDRVGIVHSVNVRRAESGPQIYLAGSTSADLSLIRPNLGVIRNGGAGFVKKDALHAAIGESLERYAAGLLRSAQTRTASWAELTRSGERAARPDAFGLFSAEQYASPGFPFTPFTEDTPVRWVPATRWADGQQCWVPASQVFLYYRRAAGEAPIAPSISTGLAAGPSFADAVLGGLCEIIERDALAISWLHRLPPRPVTEQVIAASSRVSYHLAHAASWRVAFYDLSLDLTPAVIVAVMDHRGGGEPMLSFGGACRMSPARAVEKAFLEAAQGLTYVRRLVKEHRDFAAAPDFANVDEFTKHAILYTRHPELRRRAGYLVHPDAPPACDRPARPAPGDGAAAAGAADLVDNLVRELAAGGFQTYVVDLTTPDIRRVGVRVARVLVPGLQHLSGTHRFRLLGNPRLHAVVRALGYDSAPDNPFPHPLP